MAAGDLMVRLGERTIDQPEDVLGATLEYEPGTRVPVEVVREGRRQTLNVELGRRPVSRAQPQRG